MEKALGNGLCDYKICIQIKQNFLKTLNSFEVWWPDKPLKRY